MGPWQAPGYLHCTREKVGLRQHTLAHNAHLEQKAEVMVLSWYIKSQAEPCSSSSAKSWSFGFGTSVFTIAVFRKLVALAVFCDVSPAKALRVGNRGTLSLTGIGGFNGSLRGISVVFSFTMLLASVQSQIPFHCRKLYDRTCIYPIFRQGISETLIHIVQLVPRANGTIVAMDAAVICRMRAAGVDVGATVEAGQFISMVE